MKTITIRHTIVMALLAGLSQSVYILISHLTYRCGYPLDDAWIHQTYARNLALRGEWAFLLGQPSAGSTSPLWSAIIALGYWLHLEPYVWTQFLGWLALLCLGLVLVYGWLVIVERFENVDPDLQRDAQKWSIYAGIFILFEWHLVWAAASGMETALFSLLITLGLLWIAGGCEHAFLLGLLIGVSMWLRPDGITLIAPAFLSILLTRVELPRQLRELSFVILGFALLAVPYLMFNYALSGTWWPNTFYAKQAEYAVLREIPLMLRWLRQFALMLVGTGALLLPGFLLVNWSAWRRKAWHLLIVTLWLLGYLGVYAWRLPVTYQHGRYIIPAMPLYFLLGLWGTRLLDSAMTIGPWRFILRRTWLLSIVLVLLIFWVLGGRAYGQDVAIIESEMVDTGQWIAEHTPEQAIIAVHDVGAIGYFAQRKLLDLAGLISPQVIPFIRDEIQLAAFIDRQRGDYLITFPSWYLKLTDCADKVFQTQGTFSPTNGGENMAVYRWHSPCFLEKR